MDQRRLKNTPFADIKRLNDNVTDLAELLRHAYTLAQVFSGTEFLDGQQIIIPTHLSDPDGEEYATSTLLPLSTEQVERDSYLFLSDVVRLTTGIGLAVKKDQKVQQSEVAKSIFDHYFPDSGLEDTYHLYEWAHSVDPDAEETADEVVLFEQKRLLIHLLAVLIATIEMVAAEIAEPEKSEAIVATASEIAQTDDLLEHSYGTAQGAGSEEKVDAATGGAEVDSATTTDDVVQPDITPQQPQPSVIADAFDGDYTPKNRVPRELAGVRPQTATELTTVVRQANYETQWLYNRLLFEIEVSQGIPLNLRQKHHLRLLVFRAVKKENLAKMFANPTERLKVLQKVYRKLNETALFRKNEIEISTESLQAVGEGFRSQIATILGDDSVNVGQTIIAAADGLVITYGDEAKTMLASLDLSSELDRRKLAFLLRLPQTIILSQTQAESLQKLLTTYFSLRLSDMLLATQEETALQGLVDQSIEDAQALQGTSFSTFQTHFDNHLVSRIQEGVAAEGLDDVKRESYHAALFSSSPKLAKRHKELLRTYGPVWNSLSGADQRLVYDFYNVAYDKTQDTINQLPLIPEIAQFNIAWIDTMKQAMADGRLQRNSALGGFVLQAESYATTVDIRERFLSSYLEQINVEGQVLLNQIDAEIRQVAAMELATQAQTELAFWQSQLAAIDAQSQLEHDIRARSAIQSRLALLSGGTQAAGHRDFSIAQTARAARGLQSGGLTQGLGKRLSRLSGQVPDEGDAALAAAALKVMKQSKGNPYLAAALAAKELLTNKKARQAAVKKLKESLKKVALAGAIATAVYFLIRQLIKLAGRTLALAGTGAAAGFAVGGPVGAIIGGIAGGLLGWFSSFGGGSAAASTAAGSGALPASSGAAAASQAAAVQASAASQAAAASLLSSAAIYPVLAFFSIGFVTMHVFLVMYGAFLVPTPTTTGGFGGTIGGVAGCWPTSGRITVLRNYGDGTPHATTGSIYGFQGPGTAIDIGAPIGEPVYTPFAGEAYFFAEPNGVHENYGNHVVVVTDNFALIFAHLSELAQAPSDTPILVQAGEEIGKVGNSGNSDGAHLHYEAVGVDVITIVPFTSEEQLLADTNETELWGKEVSATSCDVQEGEDDPNAIGYIGIGPAIQSNLVASSDQEINSGAVLTCNWWRQKGSLDVAINANFFNSSARITPVGLAGYSSTNASAVRYYADPIDGNGNVNESTKDQLHSLIVDSGGVRRVKTDPSQSGYLAITGLYVEGSSSTSSVRERTIVGIGEDNGTCSDGAYTGQQTVFVAVMKSATFDQIEEYVYGCGATQVVHLDGGGSTSLCSSEYSLPSSRSVPVSFGMQEAVVQPIE